MEGQGQGQWLQGVQWGQGRGLGRREGAGMGMGVGGRKARATLRLCLWGPCHWDAARVTPY